MLHRKISTRLTLGVLTGLGLIIPIACSSEPDVLQDECGGLGCVASGQVPPCEAELSGKCGDPCEVGKKDACASGLFCESGECTAECVAGDDRCDSGEICSSSGRCTEQGGGVSINLGGAGGGGGGGNQECIDVEVNFEPQIPTVVLLIDWSGSMTAGSGFGENIPDTYVPWDCNNEDWRWNVVRNVLFHPENGIVKPLESDVRFGMTLYTSHLGTWDPEAEMHDDSKTCPELTTVPIAFDNHQAMLDAFPCDEIKSDTPTGESLAAVATDLAAYDAEGPKVIILATDGEPDTCACPNFSGNVPNNRPPECDSGQDGTDDAQAARDLVVTAAATALESEIQTHIINVSNPGNAGLQAHLEDVAQAGGGAVYPGFDPAGLEDAFAAIINGVRSCTFELDGKIAAGKESQGKVVLDGEALALDDEDGWRVNSSTEIELLGEACETIKGGEHDLDISFPCGTFIPTTK